MDIDNRKINFFKEKKKKKVRMGIEVLVKIGMDFYYFKSGLNYQNETLFVAEYD